MDTLVIGTPGISKLDQSINSILEQKALELKVTHAIINDLRELNWDIHSSFDRYIVRPPQHYDKTTIRYSMSVKRQEIINKNQAWISNHIDIGRAQLADGASVIKSDIKPEIEICESRHQHNLFRLFRYYWSSPHSEYVGRRIKILIRDAGINTKPIIGIAAIGSPIIHIPTRDRYIGWDKNTRTANIVHSMDAYVVGALPPYNYLLGGKLVSYILASNEIRAIFKQKYSHKLTQKNEKRADDLVCLFTTGLYGTSSQYNRMRFNGNILYQPIGYTQGYGTLHISEQTISLIKQLLEYKGINVGNRFGDGPSWRMRLIRTAGELLGFDADLLLRHSFPRSVYFIPLAKNCVEYLLGNDSSPIYYDYPMNNLVNYWKTRWLSNRKSQPEILEKVCAFTPNDFSVS